jgi:translation initiation factor 2 subunit 1
MHFSHAISFPSSFLTKITAYSLPDSSFHELFPHSFPLFHAILVDHADPFPTIIQILAVIDRPWSSMSSTAGDEIYSVPWYPSQYPAEEEAVIVRLTRKDEMGFWVQLLEYGSAEGMIPLGQYTTRRTRRIPKSIKVGKQDTAVVSKVDREKGNMDLTRQGLKEQDIEEANKRFQDTKGFMTVLYHIGVQSKFPFRDLVPAVAYPLMERFGTAQAALHHCFDDPSLLDECQISDAAKQAFLGHLAKMFTPQEVRVQAQFEAEVHTTPGVDALRDALVAGYEDAPDTLEIHVVSAPLYSAMMVLLGSEKGLDILTAALQKIQRRILDVGGRFEVKQPPHEVSHDEHQQWRKELERSAARDSSDDE